MELLLLKKKMANIGFELKGAINVRMASNISVPYFRYNPVENEKLEKRKKRAIEKLKDFYSIITTNKKHLEGRWNILGKLGGWMQRVGMDWTLDKLLNFSIDSQFCNECMLCRDQCPTQNISFNGEKFQFGENCTYCMRCYNFCPTNAVLVNEKYCDPKNYKRHQYFQKKFKVNQLQQIGKTKEK